MATARSSGEMEIFRWSQSEREREYEERDEEMHFE